VEQVLTEHAAAQATRYQQMPRDTHIDLTKELNDPNVSSTDVFRGKLPKVVDPCYPGYRILL